MPDRRDSSMVDLENLNTSHSVAILSVPPGSTVLDVGCAEGAVARMLVERGCDVWGVERDAAAARHATPYCTQVVVGDIDALDLEAELDGRCFEVILCLDVLEHLHDPLATLRRISARLAPGGRIIASIPNITHGAVRLSLLQGAFRYTETGLLDRTHVRFFDRAAVGDLFRRANLHVIEELRVTRGLTETEIGVDVSQVPPMVLDGLQRDPDATTYQFVIVAAPAEGQAPQSAGVSLATALQHRVEELTRLYREVETYARSLEARLDERPHEQVATALAEERQVSAELRSELTARMRELHDRHAEARHLIDDLAVKDAFLAELRQRAATAEAAAAERAEAVRRVTEDLTKVRDELGRTVAAREGAATARDAAVKARDAAVKARDAAVRTRDAAVRTRDAAVTARKAAIKSLEQRAAGLRKALARAAAARDAAERARIAEVARLERSLAEVRAYTRSAGFRLVERVSLALRRYSALYGPLRRLVRRLAR